VHSSRSVTPSSRVGRPAISNSYFDTTDGIWFAPTQHARGPWSVDACHAGPPVALIVRAVEKIAADHQLARITVELMVPIPMTGFRVQAEVRRPGRSVTLTEAEIYDDDRIYARAYATHVRTLENLDVDSAGVDAPILSAAAPGPFPVTDALHDRASFGSSVEVRYDRESRTAQGGPTTIWLRTLYPILDGEEPSPFQRIAPLADCGNGISYNGALGQFSFVNADLTLSLHRPPRGEWFASRSISHWQKTGIGLADSELFDVDGAVGRATQTLLLNRME